MKITFNDGQELQIQQVTEQTDGALLIKTISAEEEQLKTLFSDAVATKRMSVSERDADTVVYENYTKLDAIVKYTAGILGVMMYQEGECDINDHYLDCKIAPKEKGTHILEVTYAVADSIRKARIEVEVV